MGPNTYIARGAKGYHNFLGKPVSKFEQVIGICGIIVFLGGLLGTLLFNPFLSMYVGYFGAIFSIAIIQTNEWIWWEDEVFSMSKDKKTHHTETTKKY